MGQDLSLIRKWHLKHIWINVEQAVSLGIGLCSKGKKVPLSAVHMSRSIHLLKMMARMEMAAITKTARPPSAEPTISGSWSCTMSERSPSKEDTCIDKHKCREQELLEFPFWSTRYYSQFHPYQPFASQPCPGSSTNTWLGYPFTPSVTALFQCLPTSEKPVLPQNPLFLPWPTGTWLATWV